MLSRSPQRTVLHERRRKKFSHHAVNSFTSVSNWLTWPSSSATQSTSSSTAFCVRCFACSRSRSAGVSCLRSVSFATLVFSICSAQRSISCACRRSCSGETVVVLLFKINAPFYYPTCGYCCICADCPASWEWKESGHSPGPQAENARYENAGKWYPACHYAVS